jgi:ribosome-binding protein aMBF1 (putative translation factor)
MKKVLASALCIFVFLTSIAQDNFKEVNELSTEKFWKKFDENPNVNRSSGKPYKMGQGGTAYYPALQKPKKVAIINFYLYDLGNYSFRGVKFGGYYKGTATTRWVGDAGDKLVNVFYNMAENSIINDAKSKYGVDVITPATFTAQQKEAYENWVTKTSGFFSKFASREDDALKFANSEGFKDYFVFNAADYKMGISYGELATALGVDAVIINKVETMCTDDEVSIMKIASYMYGPNPVQKVDGQKYFGLFGAGYNEGVFYSYANAVFGKSGVPIFKHATKKKPEVVMFDGLAETFARVNDQLWNYLINEKKCGQED